jgi:hypothetical protein
MSLLSDEIPEFRAALLFPPCGRMARIILLPMPCTLEQDFMSFPFRHDKDHNDGDTDVRTLLVNFVAAPPQVSCRIKDARLYLPE